jgi:DinB superfamily
MRCAERVEGTASRRPSAAMNLVMASAAMWLRSEWERSCDRLMARLGGLSDDEYRWEPVPGCWSVRPDAASPSGWTVDYPDVEPDPPPFTTIAWRMLHVADGNTIYWEHAFGPARRQFSDLAPHGDAAGAIAYLAESQRAVTAIVAEIDDARLVEPRPTPWGELWPAGRVLAVLLDEQVHHGPARREHVEDSLRSAVGCVLD